MPDSFAHVTIVGNVTRDPVIGTTRNGKTNSKVSIATNRNFKDAQGVWQKQTTYWVIDLWGQAAETAVAHIRKGMAVSASGDASMSEYVGRDSTHRYTLEVRGCQGIRVVERRERTAAVPASDGEAEAMGAPLADQPMAGDADIDDLPF